MQVLTKIEVLGCVCVCVKDTLAGPHSFEHLFHLQEFVFRLKFEGRVGNVSPLVKSPHKDRSTIVCVCVCEEGVRINGSQQPDFRL